MREINGSTNLFVILGQPIEHTLSPAMYNAAFATLGYNGVYVACAVAEGQLAEAVQGIRALGIKGGNVTIPYKEKIIPFFDDLTQEARLIGAVNTFYWQEGKLTGANTDGAGFFQSLQKLEPAVTSYHGAVILGAGGAARAVAVTLALAGLPEIYLVNRDLGKAQELAGKLRDLGCRARVLAWAAPELKEIIKHYPLLINTTSLGMTPWEQEKPPIDYDLISADHLVADLVYRPAETLFLKEAGSRGARTMNGLGMLLEQGVLAFNLWSGLTAPVEVMAQELARWL